MNIEKMRSEFETAIRFGGLFHDATDAAKDVMLERGSNGEYRSVRVNGAWWAWQASRESLVIELPIPKELCGPDGSYMEYFEPEQIERAIEALGLKVKP